MVRAYTQIWLDKFRKLYMTFYIWNDLTFCGTISQQSLTIWRHGKNRPITFSQQAKHFQLETFEVHYVTTWQIFILRKGFSKNWFSFLFLPSNVSQKNYCSIKREGEAVTRCTWIDLAGICGSTLASLYNVFFYLYAHSLTMHLLGDLI